MVGLTRRDKAAAVEVAVAMTVQEFRAKYVAVDKAYVETACDAAGRPEWPA